MTNAQQCSYRTLLFLVGSSRVGEPVPLYDSAPSAVLVKVSTLQSRIEREFLIEQGGCIVEVLR